MKLDLDKKIESEYHDGDKLLALVKKYELGRLIAVSIECISTNIYNQELDQIPSTACSILSQINTNLQTVDTEEEKTKLEYLLSDIFNELIGSLPNTEEGIQILGKTKNAIKTCCRIGNYDFKQFSKFIDFKEKINHFSIQSKSSYYYQWLANDWELDKLAKIIQHKKLIKSLVEFKKLFSFISNSHCVVCYEKNKDKLLVLVHSLRKCQIIKPRGTSGHFKPLTNYAMNENYDFLFSKDSNKYHNKLKANTKYYQQLIDFSIGIIKNSVSTTVGQWSDNGNIDLYLNSKLV